MLIVQDVHPDTPSHHGSCGEKTVVEGQRCNATGTHAYVFNVHTHICIHTLHCTLHTAYIHCVTDAAPMLIQGI